MSKDKPDYRPVYHFVDELLFTAFIERLPRSALTDPLRKDELLRKRNFPGFRITETTPSLQQLLAAYRKEILQRSNTRLANNLCKQWIRSSPALAATALLSLGLSAQDAGKVDTWLKKAQDKLPEGKGFDCLRALTSAVTQGFPPQDILIFVSIISYDRDQNAIREFVEREVLQTHGEDRAPIADQPLLEQRLQSAQSELRLREASREDLQRTLAHEASVAQSELEAAVREHDATALLSAEAQSSIQRLSRELAQIKASLAEQEQLQKERNTLKDRSQQTVNHRRAEMVAIASSHEQKQRHADNCVLEQSDLVSRMVSTLQQLEERILQEARAREEARIREESKARGEARAQEEAKAREQAQVQEEAKAREEARVQEEAKARDEARAQEEAKAREQARVQGGGKAYEEAEGGKVREEARLREEQFGRVPAVTAVISPEPSKRTQESLGNNAVCYQGLQRVFRNTVVGFLRARLTRLFPSDHAQRMKKLFGEQWEKAAQNAAQSREIGGTTTTVRDDYDLLGTNHFFELFDK